MVLKDYNDIVQFWIQEVLNCRGKDAEKTLKYCNDIIQYGMQIADAKLVGFGYYYCGETYYCLNDGNNFYESVTKALSYLDRAQEWELMASCYNFLGISAMNRGNGPIALDYYLNGINYAKKYHLRRMEALLEINIGVLNVQCGRFEEGRNYLEEALLYVRTIVEDESYHTLMMSIYENIAKSYVLEGDYEPVEEIFRRIYLDHWDGTEEMDRVAVLCIEAVYFHKVKKYGRRDECIARIQEHISANMAILDTFDDYYIYELMLLEADKENAFWQIIDVVEPLIRSCNITNLHLKVISLKIKYYRKHNQSAEYLQAAGLYFELSEIMEQETKNMMNNVMYLRRSLETANRVRQEMEQKNRILQEKSEMDPLTKLANRFRLNDYSEQVFERACDMERALAVEILDIDYFKEFNDNYGHQAGDHCLLAVADTLKNIAQKYGGFCARYGGDEFILIYENLSMDKAAECAKELREQILSLNMEHKFSKALPIVSISQGMCWGVPKKGTRMWDFMHRADDMLYQAKKNSRNNYCVGEISGKLEPITGEKVSA